MHPPKTTPPQPQCPTKFSAACGHRFSGPLPSCTNNTDWLSKQPVFWKQLSFFSSFILDLPARTRAACGRRPRLCRTLCNLTQKLQKFNQKMMKSQRQRSRSHYCYPHHFLQQQELREVRLHLGRPEGQGSTLRPPSFVSLHLQGSRPLPSWRSGSTAGPWKLLLRVLQVLLVLFLVVDQRNCRPVVMKTFDLD